MFALFPDKISTPIKLLPDILTAMYVQDIKYLQNYNKGRTKLKISVGRLVLMFCYVNTPWNVI
jgi:hypothetical protein